VILICIRTLAAHLVATWPWCLIVCAWVTACGAPVVEFAKFGVDSSSRFSFEARRDKSKVTDAADHSLPTAYCHCSIKYPAVPNNSQICAIVHLNRPRESHCCSSIGKEFHTGGPAVAKHRSPYVLCARWTTHVSESDDRRRRGLEWETGWQSSDKYDGAWPARHWNTRTAVLNSTRCRADTTYRILIARSELSCVTVTQFTSTHEMWSFEMSLVGQVRWG